MNGGRRAPVTPAPEITPTDGLEIEGIARGLVVTFTHQS